MLETGTVLQDRFLIEQELARGGMGAVYLATDQKFGSRVAIKERFYEHAELAEAFEREGRILNSLHHPILPHVSDCFSEGNGHFLVMEYIEGEDLSELLKRSGSFAIEDVLRWTRELLDGLDYLHSQTPPITHRDIKPGNLKLTSRGNIVLLDFGLAKETSGNTLGVRSVFGYSRRYSPLEQIEGAGTDARSDIFSLGATVFHLLTGEPPVDVLARASAIVAGRPDPLRLASDVNGEVPVELAEVIHRALSLNPETRYSSAADMREALENALSGEPEEVTQIAAAPVPAPVETFPALEAFEEDLSQTPELVTDDPPRSTYDTVPAPVVETRHKRRISMDRPFWQRPAFWAAMIVVALMAIGYAQYRSRQLADVSEAPVPQPTATPEATPETQQAPEIADTDLKQDSTPVADENPSVNEQEVASTDVTKTKKTKTADKLRNSDKRVDRSFSTDQDEPTPPQRATVARRNTRNEATQQSRRVRPRRVDVWEPPISSIEMVLTGVPPQRRRRHWPPPY